MMLIETFCLIYDKSELEQAQTLEELGIKANEDITEHLCPFCFKLEDVSCVRPEIDESGLPNEDTTIIYLKSGESFVIKMKYKDLLNQIKGIFI